MKLIRVKITKKENNSGESYRYNNIGNWSVQDGKMIRLSYDERFMGRTYGLSYKSGNFYLGGKKISRMTKTRDKIYGIKLNDLEYVYIKFNPNNSYTLKRMIENRHFEMGTGVTFVTYNFKSKKSYHKGKSEVFRYSIDTENDILMINGKEFDIRYLDGYSMVYDNMDSYGAELESLSGFFLED